MTTTTPVRSARRSLAGFLAVIVALFGVATLPTVSVANATPTATYQTFYDSEGYQLNYHRFEGGDNGVLFYFDGDSSNNYWLPEDVHVQGLRQQAAARGFDLIYIGHPGWGVSWYRGGHNPDRTAQAVREFIRQENPARIQLAGYSGGAEFLTRHLLVEGTLIDEVPTGVLLIGGGSVFTRWPVAPSPKAGPTHFHWVVGDLDDFGEVIPVWSAVHFSARAQEIYGASGYQNLRRTIVPDTHHVTYRFAELVGAELDRTVALPIPGKAAPAPVPGKDSTDSVSAVDAPVVNRLWNAINWIRNWFGW